MSKTESDGLNKISTAFLNKHKYFDGFRGDTISWTSGWSENKSSVGINVSTLGEKYLSYLKKEEKLENAFIGLAFSLERKKTHVYKLFSISHVNLVKYKYLNYGNKSKKK